MQGQAGGKLTDGEVEVDETERLLAIETTRAGQTESSQVDQEGYRSIGSEHGQLSGGG